MARIFEFSVSGTVSIDLDRVVFTDNDGNTVDTAAMTVADLHTKLNNWELQWDWLQAFKDSPQSNLDVDDLTIYEE